MIFRDKYEWSLGVWLSILICDRRGVLEVAGSMPQDHVSHKYPRHDTVQENPASIQSDVARSH